MGEVSETMTKKKKKKGRPSLLDLQKRSLKRQQEQQHQQQNLNLINSYSSISNPISPNPVPVPVPVSEGITGDDDDDDERKQKKHKPLFGLNSHQHYPTLSVPRGGVDWRKDGGDDPEAEANHKRRKINVVHRHESRETNGKFQKETESKHNGLQGGSGPTTPLPDKKLVSFILDRLQKKDTHGVFAEPVDPEELPDYHDIIDKPMDFGTVRKKLDGELYANLEQFEKDVFLICSNAMQYNAPATIYYRQARVMQEMAKKDFANLRQDSDDGEPQPKIVRRGRPPGKHTRKSLGMFPSERVGPESSSDATLASGGDNACGSNGYNLRKGLSKFQPADSPVRAFQSNGNSGGYTSWLSEWESEFPASVLKAVLRYGKNQFVVDKTRRDTYKHPMAFGNEPPVIATVEDELKQLLVVGLHVKNSYARSLARFAADLGPIVWKIAAGKIRSVLPIGHEFGPGWVGEDDVPQMQHLPVCDEEKTLDSPVLEDHRSRFPSPSGSFPVTNRSCLPSGDMVINKGLSCQNELNPLSSVGGGNESVFPLRIKQEFMVHSDDFFSSNGRLGSNFAPQMKMVKLADLTGLQSAGNVPQMLDTDPISNLTTCMVSTNINPPFKAKFLNNQSQSDSSNSMAPESDFELKTSSQGLAGKSSWQGFAVAAKQNSLSFANDLNGKIGTTNSPSSNVESGFLLQTDLSLQL